MKREPELIRKILMEVEKQTIGNSISNLEFDGYERNVINEHVRLLQENNYIDAAISHRRSNSGIKIVGNYVIFRLLNEGHDFLANARNETVWQQSISYISEKGVDVSLAVLKGVLTLKAKEYLGL